MHTAATVTTIPLPVVQLAQKTLARAPLLLANFGQGGIPEPVISNIS
jgi:hypothetical protein